MLKYTTAVNNEEGIVSPTHHKDIEYLPNTLKVSAGSKSNKMAIRKREGLRRIIKREQDIRDMRNGTETPHLPPISQSGTPQGFVPPSSLVPERKESFYPNQPMKRKDIKTPYISHMANRVTEVATPYVMHTHLSSVDHTHDNNILRENTKLSGGNVIEIRREPPELRHEATFSSLQKMPTSSSPINDKRPRGRHGRHKNSSFNEQDYNKNNDLKDLTIQSNQMGLSRRTERRPRDVARAKGDEAFSIRKKIEQFRKWHEEQYKDKIKKLKQEVDHQFEAEHTKIIRHAPQVRETPTSKNDVSLRGEVEKTSEISNEKMDQDEKATPLLSNGTSKPRTSSARTWRTWRNVNDSYAYNDVRKYIEENELMDDEKSDWIKKWIIDVNRAMKDVVHESVL